MTLIKAGRSLLANIPTKMNPRFNSIRGAAIAAATVLFVLSPAPSEAQLFKFRKKEKESSETGNESKPSDSGARRLALFPRAFRKDKEPESAPPLPGAPEGNITPSTPTPQGTPSDPAKLSLQSAILPLIPADRYYRETLADAIATTYYKNGFKPLWKGKRLPDRLYRSIGVQLVKHALPQMKALDPSTIQSAITTRQVDKKDLAKTVAIADAAALIRFGAVPANVLWPEWDKGDMPGTADRTALSFSDDLIRGMRSQPFSLDAVMQSLAPRSWIYRELQAGYERSRQAVLKYTGLPNIPDPKTYGVARPDQPYAHAPALAAHLIQKGYLQMDPQQAALLSSMTPELTGGLVAFQKDYGLEADGIMGSGTWRVLNTNPADQFRATSINLHRARLMPYDLGTRYVIVNLPTAELFGFDGGEKYSLNMRVVHGKASEASQRTPVFRDVMQEVVFGPYWNVPKTIASEELVPKARNDSSYLSRNNYEIVSSFSPSASALDFSSGALDRVEAGTLFIRQKPGSNNALGTVKFLLPNKYNIYLHDTPSKKYFQYTNRDHSHGCIRLADPKKMATWVLGTQGWTSEKVSSTIASKKRNSLRVNNRVNVYITYFTSFPRPKGDGRYVISPARDVYGLDPKDAKTLASVIPWQE